MAERPSGFDSLQPHSSAPTTKGFSVYLVRVSAGQVAGRARKYGAGRYKRIAVIEVSDDYAGEPPPIDPRRKAVVRIVRTWGMRRALWLGTTSRSAGARALDEARSLCDNLNRKRAAQTAAAFDPAI